MISPLGSIAYKRYALGLLVSVYTLNLLDRGLMGLLMQPIKEDLHLSDTQLGFVTGIAFGLFYAVFGVPIARWSDRGNRVTIASLAIALWGLTVMACLFVGTFVQLVFARIAAAVGESGCKPPTYSLLGDYFPQSAERIRAMSFYWLAGPLSTLISPIVGGWLFERYGWRMTFFIMGIPGLLMAALVKGTLREPRVNLNTARATSEPLPPIKAVLSTLWRQHTCRHLTIALILVFSMFFGIYPWNAAFMMRSHGMHTAELGLWLGIISGLGGFAGVLTGGFVASHWFAEDERGQLRSGAVAMALTVPCYVGFLLLPQAHGALLMLAPAIFAINFFVAPAYALLQRLVPDESRATTVAVIMLLYNVIGMGIAPQAVGVLSDHLLPLVGSNSLRYSMLLMAFIGLWAAYHLWRAGHMVKADLSAATARRVAQASAALGREALVGVV